MAPGIDRKSRMLVMTATGAIPVAVVRLSGFVMLRLSTVTPSSPSASTSSRPLDGHQSLHYSQSLWRQNDEKKRDPVERIIFTPAPLFSPAGSTERFKPCRFTCKACEHGVHASNS